MVCFPCMFSFIILSLYFSYYTYVVGLLLVFPYNIVVALFYSHACIVASYPCMHCSQLPRHALCLVLSGTQRRMDQHCA